MTIIKLIEGLGITKKHGSLKTLIKGIAYDSRLVQEGFIFVAVRGFSVDGHEYIKDAISRGATAIIAEDAVEKTGVQQFIAQPDTAYIEVPDSRRALALISSVYYGHPSDRLSLIGITGTNGKTTTSFITKNIIDDGGTRAGLIGTIYCIAGEQASASVNTTPESLDLQRCLSAMVSNNLKYAVLEVSSHALALNRVGGCSFNVAAFTNFSQDHLDFHGTMQEYFRAKRRLFSELGRDGTAVLNWDDPVIRTMTEELECSVITCGTEKGAMIRAENVEEQMIRRGEHKPSVPSGLSFDVQTEDSRLSIESKLIGRFNVSNILMSIGIARALGIDDSTIQRGIKNTEPVEGRFENIDEGQDFLCIVDYAHTDDALKKLIEEAVFITEGRVVTVFGCGGDRDKAKRPLMGKIASELSDVVVITSDNPRSEDPVEIIKDIVKGINKQNYSIQPDREKAIKEAVALMTEGDTLLVAGKGHENYQEIMGVRHHLSDKEILKKEIRKRLALSG